MSGPASEAEPRRRGRPVSQRSRDATLAAARELLDENGFTRLTVDEVARRSKVSKATIYKHWPDGFHLAVQAFGDTVTEAVPTVSTGHAPRDLRRQFRHLAAFYASPPGKIAADLVGVAVTYPDGGELVRERFFGQRRQDTATLIDRGKLAGQIRDDLDTNLIIDLVFGPIIFRLFNGMGPLSAQEAKVLAPIAVAAVTAASTT